MISKGYIYKIVCNLNNVVYVGSTFNQIRHRWQQHKANYNTYLTNNSKLISLYPYIKKYGIENFTIIKIKEYQVYREHKKDLKHLHAYEQLWINKLKCINKQCSFSNPLKKHMKTLIYYKDAKKKISKK